MAFWLHTGYRFCLVFLGAHLKKVLLSNFYDKRLGLKWKDLEWLRDYVQSWNQNWGLYACAFLSHWMMTEIDEDLLSFHLLCWLMMWQIVNQMALAFQSVAKHLSTLMIQWNVTLCKNYWMQGRKSTITKHSLEQKLSLFFFKEQTTLNTFLPKTSCCKNIRFTVVWCKQDPLGWK